jgi:hypothetical protein
MCDHPLIPPNPGSEEAIRRGCKCAIMDNNHGKWAPYPPFGWWVTEGCPLHAPFEKGPA